MAHLREIKLENKGNWKGNKSHSKENMVFPACLLGLTESKLLQLPVVRKRWFVRQLCLNMKWYVFFDRMRSNKVTDRAVLPVLVQ